MLEIQVLALDRHNNVARLNMLMGTNNFLKYRFIQHTEWLNQENYIFCLIFSLQENVFFYFVIYFCNTFKNAPMQFNISFFLL